MGRGVLKLAREQILTNVTSHVWKDVNVTKDTYCPVMFACEKKIVDVITEDITIR